MIGGLTPHLGSRVSALLDGRLSADDEERAWAHVHACHPCRDLVEREGAIKTQLACWSLRATPAPVRLRESLLSSDSVALAAVSGRAAESVEADQSRLRSVVVLGGSALSVAFAGVLVFGAAPANTPPGPSPVTSLTTPTPVVEVSLRTRGSGETEPRPPRATGTSIGEHRLRVSGVVVSGTMTQ